MKLKGHICCWVSFMVLVLNACKKDGDTIPPVIVINSPAQNHSYHVFDTIPLSVDISDNKQLQSPVTITLLDMNGLPVMASGTIPASSNPLHISTGFPISEVHILSGNYTLQVSASDGKNVSNAFVHMYIYAAPAVRKGVYLVSRGSGSVKIAKADTNFSISPYTVLGGDYAGSDISSYWQELYVSGLYTGNFNALNLTTGSLAWSKPAVVGSNPWFGGAYSAGNRVYVPYFNGFVRAYDQAGIQQFSSATQSNYHPGKIVTTGNYMIDEQIYVTNTSSKLVVNDITTGSGIQEIPLTQSLVQLFSKDADNVFLFGNSGGQGQMGLYTISLNAAWSPHAVPAGALRGVTQIDGDTYLIALSDGNIYKYQYTTNSMTTYLSGVNASQVFYDALKNEVLLSSANRLSSYDYSSLALKHTVLHTDTILNFHLLNNK